MCQFRVKPSALPALHGSLLTGSLPLQYMFAMSGLQVLLWFLIVMGI